MKSGVDWVTGKQLLLQVNPWFSNLGVRQNHLESWLKYKSLGFAPRVSDVIILGRGGAENWYFSQASRWRYCYRSGNLALRTTELDLHCLKKKQNMCSDLPIPPLKPTPKFLVLPIWCWESPLSSWHWADPSPGLWASHGILVVLGLPNG